ncbi:hypothetical protein C8R47DRAFT_401907 [Mycena vitilis]|nr:hypothetical protein C8R47DRAFT_401907 [Mycena vitilis]
MTWPRYRLPAPRSAYSWGSRSRIYPPFHPWHGGGGTAREAPPHRFGPRCSCPMHAASSAETRGRVPYVRSRRGMRRKERGRSGRGRRQDHHRPTAIPPPASHLQTRRLLLHRQRAWRRGKAYMTIVMERGRVGVKCSQWTICRDTDSALAIRIPTPVQTARQTALEKEGVWSEGALVRVVRGAQGERGDMEGGEGQWRWVNEETEDEGALRRWD